MSNKWKVDKDGFRNALENNEYAEYDLDDNYTLVKDADSTPYVVGPPANNPVAVERHIDDLLHDSGLLDYEEIEYDESNSGENMSIWHIYLRY